MIKVEEETVTKEKILIEKQQMLIVRNLNEKLFQQEVKSLDAMIEGDFGEIRQYAKFKSDFMKHVMPLIPSEDFAAYLLKSCLIGKVKEVVHNIDDNIEQMWSRLDEKYGDLSKVADLVINDIRE